MCCLSVIHLHHYHHRVCVCEREREEEEKGEGSGKVLDGSQFKQQLSSSFQVKILGLVHQAIENQLKSTDVGHGPFRLEGRDSSLATPLRGFPHSSEASLVAQLVKNLPAVQETQVLFLGREDPLEKEMATHSSILAWRIPRTGEPGGLQSMGSQELDVT